MKYKMLDIVKVTMTGSVLDDKVVGWYEVPKDICATFMEPGTNGIFLGDFRTGVEDCCVVYTKNLEQIYRGYIFFYEQVELVCQYTPEDNL